MRFSLVVFLILRGVSTDIAKTIIPPFLKPLDKDVRRGWSFGQCWSTNLEDEVYIYMPVSVTLLCVSACVTGWWNLSFAKLNRRMVRQLAKPESPMLFVNLARNWVFTLI
jgi:hypothetical protein